MKLNEALCIYAHEVIFFFFFYLIHAILQDIVTLRMIIERRSQG